MDQELIKRLRKGDTGSFDDLFEKYSRRIYSFGMKYLASEEDAEGLVQDVFLKVWENRKSLKDQASFKSFLFTIAYNNICNIFRHREYLKKSVEHFKLELESSDNRTTDEIDYGSVLDLIDKYVEEMPETQRMVFLKSRGEGLSSREIAREMDLSPGTVDNYISSALKFLRSKVGEDHLLLLAVALLFVS